MWDFPVSAASFSGEVDYLFYLITALVGFWFIVAEIALFYLAFRFRRREGVKALYITGETKKQLAWIFVPLALIVMCDLWIDLATVKVWNHIKINLPPAEEKVRAIGQQWSWVFVHAGPDGKLHTDDDISTVNELHVNVNKVVHFELEAKDVLHGFSVPVFRLKQDVIPGRIITGWFKPTLTGEFDIQCTKMCGIGHGLMGARIFIHTPAEYNQWMANASKNPDNAVQTIAMNQTNSNIGEAKWVTP